MLKTLASRFAGRVADCGVVAWLGGGEFIIGVVSGEESRPRFRPPVT